MTPDDMTLRQLSLDDGVEIWKMLKEIGPGENGFGNEGATVALSKLGEYLRKHVNMSQGIGLAANHVPQTTFWLYRGQRPVGMSKVRHYLTDALRRQGGHVGYCIRPAERGKGFGNVLLGLTLEAARDLGIETALITVNDDNEPSWRMVEANGGRLIKTDTGIRYYEVPTSPAPRRRRSHESK